jgi:hypothetical protein
MNSEDMRRAHQLRLTLTDSKQRVSKTVPAVCRLVDTTSNCQKQLRLTVLTYLLTYVRS